MKKTIGVILVITLLFIFAACQKQEPNNNSTQSAELLSKTDTFVYKGSGFGGGVFSITLHNDGTFSYQQGSASNYFGTGKWSLQGDVLCIEDDANAGYPFINYFRVVEDTLICQAEGSTNFMYIKLSDGESFVKANAA